MNRRLTSIRRQIEVLNLIKKLCRERNIAVMATIHDLNLAAQYCNRLVLICDGRLYKHGTPSEVVIRRISKKYMGLIIASITIR